MHHLGLTSFIMLVLAACAGAGLCVGATIRSRAGPTPLLLWPPALHLRGGWMGEPNPRASHGNWDERERRPSSYRHPHGYLQRHGARHQQGYDMGRAAARGTTGSRGPPRYNSIVVKGLAEGASEQRLVHFFESAGTVTSSKLLPANHRFPSGVAYINFARDEYATTALQYDGAVPSWNAGQRLHVRRQAAAGSVGLKPSTGLRPPAHLSTGLRLSSRDVALATAAKPWVQLLSRTTGKFYWFNKATNTSSWHVPSVVLAARDAGVWSDRQHSSSIARVHPEAGRAQRADDWKGMVKWGGRGGPEHVGQRFHRQRSTGQWIAGRLLQCKQVAAERYVHRVVWDDGGNEEWLCLDQLRWLLEKDYVKMKRMRDEMAREEARMRARQERDAKRSRPKKEVPRRVRLDSDEDETESEGEFDSFLASSDEVLPRSRRPRSAPRATVGGAVGKARRGKAKRKVARRFAHIEVKTDSPLKTRYRRGHTPPLPVHITEYGKSHWMEVLEEEERARRAAAEEILSARDLPLRLATLRWNGVASAKMLRRPFGMREALERLFAAGRNLLLPQFCADTAHVAPRQMRAVQEGQRSEDSWGAAALAGKFGGVVEGWEDYGMVVWGSGGGVCEWRDDTGAFAVPEKVWVDVGKTAGMEYKRGADWADRDQQGDNLWHDGTVVLTRDVCVDAKTQLLFQGAERLGGIAPAEVDREMRRYLSAVMWAGSKLVREQIWEGFSACAVKETARENMEYELVTRKYYDIDDPNEVPFERSQKRGPREGTDSYMGPVGLRQPVELRQSDVESFFSRVLLADVLLPAEVDSEASINAVAVGKGHRWNRGCFLPGREEVVGLEEVAFAPRRRRAEEENAQAHAAQARRGYWPGVPPRGQSERIVLPAVGDAPNRACGVATTAEMRMTMEQEHGSEQNANRKGAGERVTPSSSVSMGDTTEIAKTPLAGMARNKISAHWREHVQNLGDFVLSIGEGNSHVAALLARQTAEEGDGWSGAAGIEWLADAPYPDITALVGLRLEMEPVLGYVAAESANAGEELLAQLLPRLTGEWQGKSILLTYLRSMHDGIIRVLLHGARLPLHWLQPVSLFELPSTGPLALWSAAPGVGREGGMTTASAAAFQALRRVFRGGRLVSSSDAVRHAAREVESKKNRGKMLRRIRIRRLRAHDVSIVSANWIYPSSTAAQEVERLILTRHCRGVEVEEVSAELMAADHTQDQGWFYWLEEGAGEVTRSGRTGLVSWAMEDEGGGVGLVYTVAGWRRQGLGRWALACILEEMQRDWLQQRRTCVPFCMVADADHAMLQLMRGFGFVRKAALYQLLVGGDHAMLPEFPEDMPLVKAAMHSISPAYPPHWPKRTFFNQIEDSPLLMSPRMRYEYRLTHAADKGRRGEALRSMLASPVLCDALVEHIGQLKAPTCGLPGCRCTPSTTNDTSCTPFMRPAQVKVAAAKEEYAAMRRRQELREAGQGLSEGVADDLLREAAEETARGRARGRPGELEDQEEWEKVEQEDSSSMTTPPPSQQAEDSPYYVRDWSNFTKDGERILAMAREVAETYSLPPEFRNDSVALHVQRWRRSVWGNGKVVTAKYYSPWDDDKTGDYLRAEWIEEWMEHHRAYYDAAPKLCVTQEDDGQVGYHF